MNFVQLVESWREALGAEYLATNSAELAAFTAYAIAFPTRFLALVDTYNTLESGVRNFSVVALALDSLGFRGVGIRLDSGDLAALSRATRQQWIDLQSFLETKGFKADLQKAVTVRGKRCFAIEGNQKVDYSWLRTRIISASDDINEKRLAEFAAAGHESVSK